MSTNSSNLIVDMKRNLDALDERLTNLALPLQIEAKRQRIVDLEQEMEAPDFWNDQERASRCQKERAQSEKSVSEFDGCLTQTQDLLELLELAKDEPETVS